MVPVTTYVVISSLGKESFAIGRYIVFIDSISLILVVLQNIMRENISVQTGSELMLMHGN